MRRAFWLLFTSCLVAGALAADGPAPASKKTAGTKVDPRAKATASTKVKTAGESSTAAVVDPRATSLYRAAENLEKSGKTAGAIGMYRDLLIRFPRSPESGPATDRLKALGGKIPGPSEIKPAPPPEEAKFVRAPKPKYASQEANRAALNQALGGMINNAASAPAGGAGGYTKRAPY